MTEGSSGLKEQITVGFLELADDLTQRLPVSPSYSFILLFPPSFLLPCFDAFHWLLFIHTSSFPFCFATSSLSFYVRLLIRQLNLIQCSYSFSKSFSYSFPYSFFYTLEQNFLNTFDAVVLGESSFSFGKSLIDEILQISPSARAPKGKPTLLERLNMGGLSPDMF